MSALISDEESEVDDDDDDDDDLVSLDSDRTGPVDTDIILGRRTQRYRNNDDDDGDDEPVDNDDDEPMPELYC
jgi:hypothetical protein